MQPLQNQDTDSQRDQTDIRQDHSLIKFVPDTLGDRITVEGRNEQNQQELPSL